MKIDFNKNGGLLPVIIQDDETKKVLMLGYMNEEAYNITLKSKRVTFFSRSKNRLWTKGEESGNFLELISIKPDCDRDTLLARVIPSGAVCHKGTDTCWGEENNDEFGFISTLEKIIDDRKNKPGNDSYTASLFKKGINKIAQKVGEEAIELVIEAKDDDLNLFQNEAADLIYHLLILLNAKKTGFCDIVNILNNRHLINKNQLDQ